MEYLKGARFSIGPRWWGTEISARAVLRALSYSPQDDFDLVYLGCGPSAQALQDRRVA